MLDRVSALATLSRKLRSIGYLSDEDHQALASVPLTTKTFEAEQNILAEGQHPTQCCILLSGWTYRHKTFEDGRTQIMAINVPGDLIDLQSLDVPEMDHTLTALRPAQVACIAHDDMHRLLAENRSLAATLWRSVLIEQAIARQWLLSVGRRTAMERMAHLLCETYSRLHAVGLSGVTKGNSTFSLPLSQMKLGQIVGLSTVHTNRTLQDLRGRGLIMLHRGEATILDWPKLQKLAGFDAAYLGQGAASS